MDPIFSLHLCPTFSELVVWYYEPSQFKYMFLNKIPILCTVMSYLGDWKNVANEKSSCWPHTWSLVKKNWLNHRFGRIKKLTHANVCPTPKSLHESMWDPTSVGEENETFFIRVWKSLLSRRVLKTLRGSPKGKTQRGQYLLQMVSELDTGRCASEDSGPQGGWTVRSHIEWKGKRSIPYKGVETSP